MNATEYKQFHESYMQNNHGSSAIHTFLCIFFTVQCSLLCAIREKKNGLNQYIYEYMIMVLPMIVLHTVLVNNVLVLNLVAFVFLIIKIYMNYDNNNIKELYGSNQRKCGTRIHSITCLRALTYLITALCILAVDFKQFPRHLAKTETFGYSLMDTGVGLFVLMSGLVHKGSYKNCSDMFKHNFKFISILIILGISRYVCIKQLNYHEHVTEYGVHWNFFFSLGFCKLLCTVLLSLFKSSLFLSILVVTVHEGFLFIGLQDWVFSDTKRINLIDANREGISSCLGYVSLYLFAVHLKNVISKEDSKLYILRKLALYSIFLIIGSYLTNLYRPASRTLTNVGYCMYLSTLLTYILSIMYFIEALCSNKGTKFHVPHILDDINHNGLIYFILCNLTTGLINMLFQTLFMSSLSTFIILNVYMIFNIVVITYLKKKKIKL